MLWCAILLLCFASTILIIRGDTECPKVPSVSQDRRSDSHKLRVVQYNAEWLFIDYYSPMNCPGSGCTWVNVSEAQTHMTYVANVLKTLNPDVINLCEVEGCDELNMLQGLLADDTYIPYLKKGTDTSTGQNVGMLTRIDPVVDLYRTEAKVSYPVPGSHCGYTGSSGTYGVSKHYITEFVFNGYQVAFISAHLLANPTDVTRCAEREAQASVLQSVILSYVSQGYEIIMLGDFNDYDAEVLDMNNDTPNSRVLDILKGNQGEAAGKYTLYNVAEKVDQKDRYSEWWDSDHNCNTSSSSDYSMIDHILVTDGIKKNIENVFIYHGYDEYCGTYNSDHYPVVVDLKL